MKKIFFFIAGLLCSFSYAENSVEALTQTFFEKYEHNTDDAFDYIFKTNPWLTTNTVDIEKIKLQFRETGRLTGKYLGVEKLTEQSLGNSLKVAVYLVKYERQPLRFILKFYKGKKDWMLYNLKFDENIDDELDDIMKLDYLKAKSSE